MHGGRAWAGCILGFFYIPVLILSEENINKDLNALAARVVKDINEQLRKQVFYERLIGNYEQGELHSCVGVLSRVSGK